MKKLTLILAGFAILAAGFAVNGCKPDSSKPRIALVMKSLANEFFKTMEDGARDHQKKHPDRYELLASGTADEQSVAQQADIVQKMVAQRVAAIVLTPADSKALVPVCKQALDAGIVVVNIDNKLDEGALKEKGIKVPFVGPDNRKGARMAAEYLAKSLQKGDEVAIIEGKRGTFNAEQRRLGFEDAIQAAGLKVVTSQSANWEMQDAEKIVGPILTANPGIKALLCANDSMALGALSVVRAAGKVGQVKIIGFDNISAVQELIRKGEIVCTVDQHADEQAVYGIDYALQILAKQAAPSDKETPVDLITPEKLSAK